jgi:hypothetical protein
MNAISRKKCGSTNAVKNGKDSDISVKIVVSILFVEMIGGK